MAEAKSLRLLSVPTRCYRPISYGIQRLSQLLSAHRVSISPLQFQIMLSKLSPNSGRLREFVHKKVLWKRLRCGLTVQASSSSDVGLSLGPRPATSAALNFGKVTIWLTQ
jgi:hypothetical protein